MSTRRPGGTTPWRWLAAMILLAAMLSGGCAPQNSPIIVVPDSAQVFFLGPNEPARAPWPAVIVSRGRYQELVAAEMAALSHGWK
jgi:hypothetical protein